MDKTIATLEDISKMMGTIGKFFRLMFKAGATLEHVKMLIGSREKRTNLVDYLKAGCPKVVGAVKAVVDLVSYVVKVDCSLTPQQVIAATGCKQYINRDVLATMPRGKGDEVELFFVKSDRIRTSSEVNDLLAKHGLVLAYPDDLAAFNAANPGFADDHPNATYWKDANGNCLYIAFHRWLGERDVNVNRNDDKWDYSWWFAGRRQ